MLPITTLRMIDIHSSAARLLPKPMLANAAKKTRMLVRSRKRTSTWVELSCRGRCGDCAKTGYSDGRSSAASAEIVAADRLAERVNLARHRGNAGPARRRTEAPGVYERAQDRQRQIRMPGFDRMIEPIRQFALARQRAVPLAVIIGDATKLPLRQFQIDQRQRRIGPGGGSDQLLDPRRLRGLSG